MQKILQIKSKYTGYSVVVLLHIFNAIKATKKKKKLSFSFLIKLENA